LDFNSAFGEVKKQPYINGTMDTPDGMLIVADWGRKFVNYTAPKMVKPVELEF
jgi:hypothetical protein